MSEGGEGFLSRWSRRKRAAAAAPPPAAPGPAAPGPAAPAEAASPPPAGAEPAFDPASLPPVESLTATSDFTAFLREEVPAALRNAALRRAWSLDPVIRDFVGPADFAWDFNAPDGGMPGFSLDLPRDVERLLAQAVGLDAPSPGDEGEPEGPTAAPAVAEGAPPPPDPAPAEDPAPGSPARLEADGPEAGPVEMVRLDTDQAGAGARAPAPARPLAEAPSGPPAGVLQDAGPKRRHGGALPT